MKKIHEVTVLKISLLDLLSVFLFSIRRRIFNIKNISRHFSIALEGSESEGKDQDLEE